MRVLMFGWEFPPYNSGGLGVACCGLAQALAAKNIDILFVLPKKLNIKNDFLNIIFADIGNLDIKAINSLLKPYISSEGYEKVFAKKGNNLIYGATLFEEVYRYAKCAKKIAQNQNFDIIHAHDWLSFGAGVEAKRVSGKPLVVHVHATEFDRSGGNNVNEEVYEIEKEGLREADKVIAVSQYVKDGIACHYGISPEKVCVVHNGVSQDICNQKVLSNEAIIKLKEMGYKIVLFLGRITLQKGPDYFVQMAAKILKKNPKAIFVVVGSGDMQGQMIEQTAQLGISDKFFFPGFLRDEEKNEIYKLADLFVMPSVSEPFGIVSLEALINDTPVIISKQSGVSEILSHALKVDFWDVDDMADKALSVLKHKSLHQCLSQNGKLQAQNYTWDKAADKCIALYSNL